MIDDTSVTPESSDSTSGVADSGFDAFIGDSFEGYSDYKEPVSDETDVEDSSSDDADVKDDKSSTDTKSEEDKFELDGLDLTHIPKEFRRDTISETIKAIDEARINKEKAASEASVDLEKVKGLLKDEGIKDGYTAQYIRNVSGLKAEVKESLDDAFTKLQHLVDTNQISEAQANIEYGRYQAELETLAQSKIQETYQKTNITIIEDFVKKNEEVLKNPLIQEVATSFLTDVIKDGNMVDLDRSTQYLSLGKKLYDEGYKAALADLDNKKQQTEQQQLKRKVANPTTGRGGKAPNDEGIPYASASEVPSSVWNADTAQSRKIRNYFLKKEPLNLF